MVRFVSFVSFVVHALAERRASSAAQCSFITATSASSSRSKVNGFATVG